MSREKNCSQNLVEVRGFDDYVESCDSPVAAELHSSGSHRPGIALQIPVLHLFMFKKTIPPLFPFKMGGEGVEED